MSDQNDKRANSPIATEISNAKGVATVEVKEQNAGGDASVTTAVAAATSSLPRGNSPADRCHPDHLSIALSFLDMKDFAASRRVSRNWKLASERHSAWPSFDLQRSLHASFRESFLSGARRVRVNIAEMRTHDYGLSIRRLGSMARLVASSIWRDHTSELHLWNDNGESGCSGDVASERQWEWVDKVKSLESKEIIQLAKLPQLRSLTLELVAPNKTSIRTAFRALAPMLEVLNVITLTDNISEQVGLLTNLRILRLTKFADPTALSQLHQLQHLHLEDVAMKRSFCFDYS